MLIIKSCISYQLWDLEVQKYGAGKWQLREFGCSY